MRTEETIAPEIDLLPSVPLPDAIGSLSQLIVPSPNRNQSPSLLTIADVEHDDIPIQFSVTKTNFVETFRLDSFAFLQTESTKTIVFATTFIDRQQKVSIPIQLDFLFGFSSCFLGHYRTIFEKICRFSSTMSIDR